MASAYRRDDKQFREQIGKLADAGLNLDRTQFGQTKAAMESQGYKVNQPKLPTPSRSSLLICGFVAYAALAGAFALTVKYIILPLWHVL